ncbi:MAG: DUF58 domain-containing protein [Myxococcales bacterium]|nr:DUF58 domain-containing protein [Myxococcales bacterium]
MQGAGAEVEQAGRAAGAGRGPGDGAARPKRRSRPSKRYFRTTREGWVFILVTGGVGLAAINTGNNLVFLVFGFMLSLIVLSGVMSEIVLRSVRIERNAPERAFAGSPCLVELSLENKKRRIPSYSLEVEDLAENAPTERRCYFLKVAAGAKQVAGYRRVPQLRGYFGLRGYRVATRYPFGIIEKWRIIEAPERLLVYPALMRDEQLLTQVQSLGSDAATARIGAGTDVAGLRPHRVDDEARHIHWKRSAALGRLVVLETHRDSSARLSIRLDNARPPDGDRRWDEAFERAISRAAGLAVAALARECSVEIVCRGARSPLAPAAGSADPVLTFLALLESVERTEAAPMLAAPLGSRVIDVKVTPAAPSPVAA